LVTIFLNVSIALNCFIDPPSQQNRRQKVFNRGLLRRPWICKLCRQTSPKR